MGSIVGYSVSPGQQDTSLFCSDCYTPPEQLTDEVVPIWEWEEDASSVCEHCGHSLYCSVFSCAPPCPVARKEIYTRLENDYMAYGIGDSWFCLDHAIIVASSVEALDHRIGYDIETIHEDTVQFEQFPGESIPLDGVTCATCGCELYAPMGGDDDC